MTAIPGASFTEPATAADARAGDLRGITLDRPRVIVDVNLLLRDGDSILLGLRRGGFAAGMYSPPAGHLELGESVRDALIRETREEIGITIAPGDARFVQVMLVPAQRPAQGTHGPLHPRRDRLLRRRKPSGTHSLRLVTPLPARGRRSAECALGPVRASAAVTVAPVRSFLSALDPCPQTGSA